MSPDPGTTLNVGVIGAGIQGRGAPVSPDRRPRQVRRRTVHRHTHRPVALSGGRDDEASASAIRGSISSTGPPSHAERAIS